MDQAKSIIKLLHAQILFSDNLIDDNLLEQFLIKWRKKMGCFQIYQI